MVLNDPERRYFMLGIAAYMGARNLPNQIDRHEFTEAVTLLYGAVPASVSLSVGGLQARIR